MPSLAVVGALLALMQANAETAPVAPSQLATAPPEQHVIVNPDWVRRPRADDMVWPGGAYYAHVAGRAVINCLVNVVGRLEQCSVLSEAPKGWGFGDAALASARYFQMRPMTRDGQPVDGARVHIPIQFGRLPGRP